MARLMREGCDERASLSAEGRGLSLNFWFGLVSPRAAVLDVGRYLVKHLAILVQARVYGLQVLLGSVQRLLEGLLELCEGQRCRTWVCAVLVSNRGWVHTAGGKHTHQPQSSRALP